MAKNKPTDVGNYSPWFGGYANIEYPRLNYPTMERFYNRRIDENAELRRLDFVLSLEEKMELIRKKGLEKSLNMEGFSDGYIIAVADADTIGIIDSKTQEPLNTRVTDPDIPFLDAIEAIHTGAYKDTFEYYKDRYSAINEPFDFNTDTSTVRTPSSNLYNTLETTASNLPEETKQQIQNQIIQEAELARQKGLESNQITEQIRGNKYKETVQPELVAKLRGKHVDDLTEEDYDYAARFQINRFLTKARATTPYEDEPYDPNIDYSPYMEYNEKIPIKYRITGLDKYERPTVELVNANTLEPISFNMAKDPYINANFKLEDALDTTRNKIKLNKRIFALELQKVEEIARGDADGRILETIDLAQSALYTFAANVLSNLPDNIIRRLDSTFFKRFSINKISDVETGQEYADFLAGVRKSTREDSARINDKATQDFIDGNYFRAILGFASNLDRLVADSAADLLVMSGSAAISGGTSILLKLASLGGFALPIASAVGRDAKEYEYNNDGLKYTASQYALNIALTTALYYPERLALKFGINNFIKKPVRTALKEGLSQPIPVNVGKAVGASTVGEFFQESLDATKQEYMTQSQKAELRRTALEILQDPTIWAQGVAGGLAGGAVAGSVVLSTNVATIPASRKRNKAITAEIETRNTTTLSGEEAVPEADTKVRDSLSKIDTTKTDTESVTNTVKQLEELQKTEGISQQTEVQIQQKMSELLSAVIGSDNIELIEAIVGHEVQSKAGAKEVIGKIVYGSDPDADNAITLDQAKRLGKKLGLTEEEVNELVTNTGKTAEEVNYEIKYDPVRGYKPKMEKIASLSQELQNSKGTTKNDTARRDYLKRQIASYKRDLNRIMKSQVSKLGRYSGLFTQLFSSKRRIAKVEGEWVKEEDVLKYSTKESKGVYLITNEARYHIDEISNFYKSINEPVPQYILDAAHKHLSNIEEKAKLIREDYAKTKRTKLLKEKAKGKDTETKTIKTIKKEDRKARIAKRLVAYTDSELETFLEKYKDDKEIVEVVTKELELRKEKKEAVEKNKIKTKEILKSQTKASTLSAIRKEYTSKLKGFKEVASFESAIIFMRKEIERAKELLKDTTNGTQKNNLKNHIEALEAIIKNTEKKIQSMLRMNEESDVEVSKDTKSKIPSVRDEDSRTAKIESSEGVSTQKEVTPLSDDYTASKPKIAEIAEQSKTDFIQEAIDTNNPIMLDMIDDLIANGVDPSTITWSNIKTREEWKAQDRKVPNKAKGYGFTPRFSKDGNIDLTTNYYHISQTVEDKTKPKTLKNKLEKHRKDMIAQGVKPIVATQQIALIEAIGKIVEENTKGRITTEAILDFFTVGIINENEMSPEMKVLYQKAFHGSPHRFEKFMLEHINSGEGTQHEGWGLYFTSNKETAEWYRKVLTSRTDHKYASTIKPIIDKLLSNFDLPIALYEQYINDILNSNNLEALINSTKEWVQIFADNVAFAEKTNFRGENYLETQKNSLKEHSNKLKIYEILIKNIAYVKSILNNKNTGQVYKVDIPDSSSMLYWNGTQSNQLQKILVDIYKKEFNEELENLNSVSFTTLTDENIYNYFSSNIFEIVSDLSTYIETIKEETAIKSFQDLLSNIEENNLSELEDRLDLNYSLNDLKPLIEDLVKAEKSNISITGHAIYNDLVARLGSKKDASLLLNKYNINGIVYNGNSGLNYVIFDDTSIEVLETYYQTAKDGTAKGAIQFLNNNSLQAIVQYFKDADASTPPHELAHFSRRLLQQMAMLPDADNQVKADWKAANDFVGAKLGEEWTVAQEEKFADAFLVYLNEGKAPSPELESVFKRFANWLSKLYKDIKETLGIELNDKIRGVFDRLLANDVIQSTESIGNISGDTQILPDTLSSLSVDSGMSEPILSDQEYVKKIKSIHRRKRRESLKDYNARIKALLDGYKGIVHPTKPQPVIDGVETIIQEESNTDVTEVQNETTDVATDDNLDLEMTEAEETGAILSTRASQAFKRNTAVRSIVSDVLDIPASDIDPLVDKVNTLRNEIINLNNTLFDLKESKATNEEISEVQKQIRKAKNALKKAEQNVIAYNITSVNELLALQETLDREISTAEEIIAVVDEEIATEEKNLRTLSNTINKLDREIKKTKKVIDNSKSKNKIEAYTKLVQEYEKQLKDTETQYANLRKTIDSLHAEKSTYRTDIKALREINIEERFLALNKRFNTDVIKSIVENHIPYINSLTKVENEIVYTAPETIIGQYKVKEDSKYMQTLQSIFEAFIETQRKGSTMNRLSLLQRQMSNESPAYALLFNPDGTFNSNMLLAIDYAMKEYIVTRHRMLNPATTDDIIKALSLSRDTELSSRQISIARENGGLRTLSANLLGESITKMLGLSQNKKTGTRGFLEIQTNLGNIALLYGEARGWLETSTVENKKYTTKHIKFIGDDGVRKTIRNSYDSLAYLRVSPVNQRLPLYKKPKDKDNYKTIHNRNLTSAGTEMVMALNKTRAIEYTPNVERIDFIIKNRDAIVRLMGYTEDVENLSYKDKVTQLAVNEDILNELDFLIENKDKPSIWFDWNYVKNGRMMIDSSTLNGQKYKQLHRFLVLPKSFKIELDTKVAKQRNAFYYALAQAFGHKSDSRSNRDTKAFAEKTLKLNPDKIEAALLQGEDALKELGIKVENVGQMLLGIQAIRDYNSRVDGKFTTTLVAENDSTTSGFFLKYLQFPFLTLKHIGEKLGITSTKTTIHSMKSKSGFLDIYETIAAKFKSMSVAEFREKLQDSEKEFYFFDIDSAVKAYEIIKDVLPSAIDGNVSSELRKLFKPPTMTFMYSRGELSTAISLGEQISNSLVTDYLKIKNGTYTDGDVKAAKIEEYFTFIRSATGLNEEAFINALKSEHLDTILMQFNNQAYTSVGAFTTEIFATAYGTGVYDALAEEFSPFIKANSYLNAGFVAMFHMFNDAYKKAIKEATNYGKKVITVKEEEAIVKELFTLFPAIKTAYDNSLEHGITIYDTAKKYDSYKDNTKESNKIHFNKEHESFAKFKANSITTTPNIREFIEAGLAGAVLPIHFADGGVLAKLINSKDYDIFTIHDAIMVNLLNMDDAAQGYNFEAYGLNANYDLLAEVLGRLTEVFNDPRTTDKKVRIHDPYRNNPAFPNHRYDGKESKYKTMNVSELIEYMTKMNEEVQREKKRFYKIKKYISNNDSVDSTISTEDYYNRVQQEINENIAEELSNETEWKAERHYDPDATDEDFKNRLYGKIHKNPLTSIAERLKIVDLLRSIDRIVVSDEYVKYIKNLLSMFNFKRFGDVEILLNQGETDRNFARLHQNQINILMAKSDSIIDPMDTSTIELYAHEMLHGISEFLLDTANENGKSKELRFLQNIQKKAMEIITPEDFLPPNPTEIQKDKAQRIWNYIFNNPDYKSLGGLKEFVSYAFTNERIMNKLKDLPIVDVRGKTSALDAVINTLKRLIDFITGEIPFTSVFGDKKTSTYAHMLGLLRSMEKADSGAIERLSQSPYRAVSTVFKALGWVKDTGDKTFSPFLKWLFDYEGKRHLNTPLIERGSTRWEQAAWMVKNIPPMMFSKAHREALPQLLQFIGLSQQGFLQTVLRDTSRPDFASSQLEALSALTRMTEQGSKAIEYAVAKNLKEAFGFDEKTDLTDKQKESLTRVFLNTDIQSLFDGTDVDTIIRLLNNDAYLKEQLKIYLAELKHLVSKEDYNFYAGSAIRLAYFMNTGLGDEALALNARNIADKLSTDHPVQASDEIVTLIDKIVTLRALEMTDPVNRKEVANLDVKGTKNFLIAHQRFVEESKAEVLPVHMVKGYTKQILSNSLDLQIAPATDKAYMKSLGYKQVHILATSKIIPGNKGLALYQSIFKEQRRVDGASFLLTGQHSLGKNLETFAGNDLDKEALHGAFMAKARNIRNSINRYTIAKGDALDMKTIRNLSDNFTPLFNPVGTIADFRTTMANETKENVLKQNLDGITILSKMYASKHMKQTAPRMNNELIKFLVEDMKINLEGLNEPVGRNNKNYIELSPDSANKYIREAYNRLPSELIKYMHKDKSKPFMIREDWATMLFGVMQASVTDFNFISKLSNPYIKKAMVVAEAIIKHIAYFAKQNIVIRTPKVLIGNIISNINYSVMNGQNFFEVCKAQIENAQHVRDYVMVRKQLDAILFKQRIGTITDAEAKSINWYNARLYNNPVRPLMEKGMYQAIVEDIAQHELESTGKVTKFIQEKVGSKLPKKVRTVAANAYMLEGTPVFEFIRQATQYSDFVARATEYRYHMKNAPKVTANPDLFKEDTVERELAKIEKEKQEKAYIDYETNLSHHIMNAFINYDKPSSAFEQYLNDMGLVMFTKFSKRILHVLSTSLITHPVSALMFILGQYLYWDSAFGGMMGEDITEQVPWSKNYSALIHTPLDNLISTLVPSVIKSSTYLDIGIGIDM